MTVTPIIAATPTTPVEAKALLDAIDAAARTLTNAVLPEAVLVRGQHGNIVAVCPWCGAHNHEARVVDMSVRWNRAEIQPDDDDDPAKPIPLAVLAVDQAQRDYDDDMCHLLPCCWTPVRVKVEDTAWF